MLHPDCQVKRVANDGYPYIFCKKCTGKRGLAVIYPKLQWYYLVDLAVKHECEMVSVTYKFKPDRVLPLEIVINSHELSK